MPFFALTSTDRYDLNAESEQKARHIADNILKLSQYQIQTHDQYWKSGRGKAEQVQLGRGNAIGKVRRHANALIKAIAPIDPDTLDFLWPMLNQAQAPQGMSRIRAIQAYAKSLERNPDPAYDPALDLNWP